MTGQWLTTDGARWWFDTGSLSLDFGRAPLETAADLEAWLGERYERIADEASQRDLTDALALQTAISRIARAQVEAAKLQPDDIDTVNLFAATPDIPPAIEGGHRQAGRGRVRAGQALSTIARDVVHLVARNAEGRIRECDADDCALVFYDESRTNNRRWCSMQRCGNRAKVRAFRAKGKL